MSFTSFSKKNIKIKPSILLGVLTMLLLFACNGEISEIDIQHPHEGSHNALLVSSNTLTDGDKFIHQLQAAAGDDYYFIKRTIPDARAGTSESNPVIAELLPDLTVEELEKWSVGRANLYGNTSNDWKLILGMLPRQLTTLAAPNSPLDQAMAVCGINQNGKAQVVLRSLENGHLASGAIDDHRIEIESNATIYNDLVQFFEDDPSTLHLMLCGETASLNNLNDNHPIITYVPINKATGTIIDDNVQSAVLENFSGFFFNIELLGDKLYLGHYDNTTISLVSYHLQTGDFVEEKEIPDLSEDNNINAWNVKSYAMMTSNEEEIFYFYDFNEFIPNWGYNFYTRSKSYHTNSQSTSWSRTNSVFDLPTLPNDSYDVYPSTAGILYHDNKVYVIGNFEYYNRDIFLADPYDPDQQNNNAYNPTPIALATTGVVHIKNATTGASLGSYSFTDGNNSLYLTSAYVNEVSNELVLGGRVITSQLTDHAWIGRLPL